MSRGATRGAKVGLARLEQHYDSARTSRVCVADKRRAVGCVDRVMKEGSAEREEEKCVKR